MACFRPLPPPAATGRPRRFCDATCRMRAHRRRAVLYTGDAAAVLEELPTGAADMVVTSPPYLGLRDYGADGQLGTESVVDGYVAALVAVFDRLAQVLRPDGTAWLVLGDRYSNTASAGQARSGRRDRAAALPPRTRTTDVAPRGGLLHLPARVGIALAGSGWLTRNTITWFKPNALPHRTRTRLATRTECVLVLSRSLGAAVDLDALPESGDVWTISTVPSPVGHPAAFPPEVARRAILAGSRPGQTVLDPFCGSATTGVVALAEGRPVRRH